MNLKQLKLYNTLSRTQENFTSIEAGQAKVYCCGPTVYDFQHIGNFKTFIIENLLVKTLQLAGYQTKMVMCITDIGHLTSDGDEGEDKMIVAMRREGKTSAEIAQFYTDKFFEDWDKLALDRPDASPKATDHIQDIIDLVKKLEDKGVAYFSDGNVYYDVSKFEDYGKLALLDLEKLQAGARIQVDQNKRNPHDFVLWFTKSKFENHELLWDSPWGPGYPGWHIECSAMSMKYLGEQFDIHCGGIDHVPVHHTNEIAQSEAATGKKYANFWVHSEFILLNSEKMSKSKGGFIILDDLIKDGFDPLSFKFLCLSTHYRKQLNYSTESMKNAETNLKKLQRLTLKLKESGEPASKLSPAAEQYLNDFTEALLNDLNSPQAIAVIWKALDDQKLTDSEKLSLVYHFDDTLLLNLRNLEAAAAIEIPEAVQKLADQRAQARADKDWAKSDQLRDEINQLGFQVLDQGGQQTLEKI